MCTLCTNSGHTYNITVRFSSAEKHCAQGPEAGQHDPQPKVCPCSVFGYTVYLVILLGYSYYIPLYPDARPHQGDR